MSEELEIRQGWECELEIRAGGDGRTVTGLVAPWDFEITASGPAGRGTIREVLRRGALTQSINRRGEKIPLTFYHPEPGRPFADKGIIGKPVEWLDSEAGQRASFRVAKTSKGDEALEMIREGLITDFSIGFSGLPDKTKVVRQEGEVPLYERYEIVLDHVALVPNGAYPTAVVEEVRSETAEPTMCLAVARQKLITLFN